MTKSIPVEARTSLLVGEVVKPHGLRGEVAVKVFSDNPVRFAPRSELAMGLEPDKTVPTRVVASRQQAAGLLVCFEGCEDRNQAEALRGQLLFVFDQELHDLGPDAYWAHELVGSQVNSLQGAKLGWVSEVLERAGQDLFVVQTGSAEVLLPAAKDLIKSIDTKAKLVVADPPPGLFPGK